MDLYKMIKCNKPEGELIANTRRKQWFQGTNRKRPVLCHQFLAKDNLNAYNFDGKNWYKIIHDASAVRKYMAMIGAKGGRKSKRKLTSEQAKEMVAKREAKRFSSLT